MNIINKVKVNICGKEYNLQTDETQEYITALAKRVDKEINDLMKLKPNFGVQNAAVFVALTALDEAEKAGSGVENIRTQIKTYVNDAAKARAAKDKLSLKVKELEEKIAALEKENKELKKRPPIYECEQLVLENTIPNAVTIYAEDNQSVQAESEDNKEDTTADKQAAVDDNGSSASSGEKKSAGEQSADSEQKGGADENDRGGAENPEAEDDGVDAQNDDVRKNKGRKRKKH